MKLRRKSKFGMKDRGRLGATKVEMTGPLKNILK
jgi:hypothetical protein